MDEMTANRSSSSQPAIPDNDVDLPTGEACPWTEESTFDCKIDYDSFEDSDVLLQISLLLTEMNNHLIALHVSSKSQFHSNISSPSFRSIGCRKQYSCHSFNFDDYSS